MINISDGIGSLIGNLARTNPRRTIAEVEQIIREVLAAEYVQLGAPGGTPIGTALRSGLAVDLHFHIEVSPGGMAQSAPQAQPAVDAQPSAPQARVAAPPPPRPAPAAPAAAQDPWPDFEEESQEDMQPQAEPVSGAQRIEELIRELDRQERSRDFVWIGYLVKTFLPNLGMDPRTAQQFVNGLRDKGLLVVTKRANPNNPDFPASCVHLNRQHPTVRQVLGAATAAPAAAKRPGAAPGQRSAPPRPAADDPADAE